MRWPSFVMATACPASGRAAAVTRTEGPAVAVRVDPVVAAGDQHRLDGRHRPVPQRHAPAGPPSRVALPVPCPPNPSGRPVSGFPAHRADGEGDVADPVAHRRRRDARVQGHEHRVG